MLYRLSTDGYVRTDLVLMAMYCDTMRYYVRTYVRTYIVGALVNNIARHSSSDEPSHVRT